MKTENTMKCDNITIISIADKQYEYEDRKYNEILQYNLERNFKCLE